MKLQNIAFLFAIGISIGLVGVFLGGLSFPEKQTNNASVRVPESTSGFIAEHLNGSIKDLEGMEVWELVKLKDKIGGLKERLNRDFEISVSGILDVLW